MAGERKRNSRPKRVRLLSLYDRSGRYIVARIFTRSGSYKSQVRLLTRVRPGTDTDLHVYVYSHAHSRGAERVLGRYPRQYTRTVSARSTSA